MPRGRKRAADGSAATTSGISRRSTTGAGGSSQESNPAVAAMDPAMMNVWGDFMADTSEFAAKPAASSDGAPKEESKPAAKTAESASSSGPRSYNLPIMPRMNLASSGKKKSGDSNDNDVPTPGLLAQTGTLDASVPGRSAISKDPQSHELLCPTLIFPSVFGKNTKIAFIATSPTACHSIAITTDGKAYGWGRNETGQLGLGYSSAVVPTPTLITVGDDTSIKFVGGGVGKYHTILVGDNGLAYASGGNLCGQLGINNMGNKGIDKFRKCSVVGQLSAEDGEESDGVGNVKIVQASCGENISALLSSTGHLYTTGSSEFGQLGNGETGEYIVTAGKTGFANCAKFIRRSIFVQSEADRDGVMSNSLTSGAMDSQGKVKCVSLEDSGQIALGSISCGKNHIIAVEASSEGASHVPRVFSFGCGDYGCLGHGIQADEYTPRMIGAFKGPIFANNHPVSAVAGSNCSVVLTKHGHAYYMGKHKTAGEATMRPTLVDALANNGHVIEAIGAGSQTVFCATKSGVTVSWGNGSHGELGFGAGEKKSSSKPEFVSGLDSCLVTSVACGMGHTLFIIRNEDAEDAKALKKVPTVEESDVASFVDEIKDKAVEEAEQPKKKKGRPSSGK